MTFRNYSIICKLNNILLNNPWIKEEIKREIINFELSESVKATYQIVWDITRAVFKMKFMAQVAYVRKNQKSQINDLNFHWKTRKRRINETKCKQKGSNKDCSRKIWILRFERHNRSQARQIKINPY